MKNFYDVLSQPRTLGRYSNLKRAKLNATKIMSLRILSVRQKVIVGKYSDGSFDWIPNTEPLPLPQGFIPLEFFTKFNKQWRKYG